MLVVSTKFKTEKFGLSWQSGGYLRLRASIEGGVGLIIGWETKISHAKWHGLKAAKTFLVSKFSCLLLETQLIFVYSPCVLQTCLVHSLVLVFCCC